jgi:site-specific DNA recombinase
MDRLIGYCRVSTEEQARFGVSLAVQEERIRAYATFVGAEIVDVVVDRGFSGRKADRPGKLSAIQRILDGEADGLVVYAIDRLSRSTIDLLWTVQMLLKAGRGFVSCREQLDSSTPHGRFTLTILAALAEMESELIGERTAAAMHRLKLLGRPVGRGRYGCRIENGRFVEISDKMQIVNRILELRDANSTSYRRIAEILNSEDVEPPGGGPCWYASSVRSVEMTERDLRQKILDA